MKWGILLIIGLLAACGQPPASPTLPPLRQTTQALDQKGLLYLVTPNPMEAIDYFEAAIKLEPTVAKYHFDLGVAYFYYHLCPQAIALDPSYRTEVAPFVCDPTPRR